MVKYKTVKESQIIDEIRGINYGGFEGGGAFASFRTNYYEKILDAAEKVIVEDILLELLRNKKYELDFRSKVAWICGDINMPGAEDEIKKLSSEIKGSIYSTMIKAIMDRMNIEKQLINEISKTKRTSDKQSHNEIYSEALTLQRKSRGDVSKMYATKDKKLIEKKEDELSRYVINSLLKKIMESDRSDPDLKDKVKMMLADLNIDVNNLRI